MMWQGSKRRLVGETSNQGQAGYMCVWTSRATYSQSSYHILQRYDSSAKRPLPCCRSSGSLPFLSRNIHLPQPCDSPAKRPIPGLKYTHVSLPFLSRNIYVPIDRLLPQPIQDHTRRPCPLPPISTSRPTVSSIR